MTDRIVNMQGETIQEYGYPYEILTPPEVANIQRLRDEHMRKLRQENQYLSNLLYHAQQRLKQILSILEEMDIDIDVMIDTKKAFADRDPRVKLEEAAERLRQPEFEKAKRQALYRSPPSRGSGDERFTEEVAFFTTG